MTELTKKVPIKLQGLLKDRSLKFKVMFYFILLTVFSYSVINLLVYQSYQRASEERIANLSKAVVNNLYSNFNIIYNEINSLSLDIFSNRALNALVAAGTGESSNKYLTKQEVESILGQFMNTRRYVKSIRLYSRDLNYYCVENGSMIKPDGFQDTMWYEEAQQANGRLITSGSYAQAYEDWLAGSTTLRIVSFARVIKELENSAGKDPIGVLVIDIKEEFFNQLFSMKVSESSLSILYDKYGNIITGSANAPEQGEAIYDSFTGLLPELGRDEAKLTVNGRQYHATFITFPKPGWTLLNLIPVSDMSLDVKTISQYTVIFTLVCVFINILLSVLMTQSISRPIQRLLSAISQVKKGNFKTKIEIRNHDEIGAIGLNFNEMVDNIDRLLRENYMVKLKEQEAQISSLQAQINPHFLYNTLDTINWKIMLAGHKDICKMISSLGEILRYGISKPNDIVTVQEEITQVNRYLYIQQCRYGDKFTTRVDIAGDALQLKLHKLLIQPIVENAITHGLENKEENGLIEITGSLDRDTLVITIYDNGCGIPQNLIEPILAGMSRGTENQAAHSHIGIYNVNKRIQMYYGESFGLAIKSAEGEYTEVTLRFPAIQ